MRDRVLEAAIRGRNSCRRVCREVRHVDVGVGEGRGHCRDRRHPRCLAGAVLLRELEGRDHHGRAAVAGGADLEEPQRVGHHRRAEHLLFGEDLLVAGVGIRDAVPAVLRLHVGEVLFRRPVEIHPAPRVEAEVGGVRGAQQPEAQPVRVEDACTLVGRQEALGRGVGADDHGHVTHAREDPGARRLQGLGARRAGRVVAADRDTRPAHGLGKGGTRHVTRIAVPHGVAARHELDLLPTDVGVGKRGLHCVNPVLDEVPAPLAPGMHPHPENRNVVLGHFLLSFRRGAPTAACARAAAVRDSGQAAIGFHFQTTYSFSSSS